MAKQSKRGSKRQRGSAVEAGCAEESGWVRVVHPNAAGIDVGSEQHYVAVPEGRDEQAVRSFGCCTPSLEAMAEWLKKCGVETVAMESTGVYWVPVYRVLESHGLEVHLVDARHVRHVPGRKTDVQDCQWLQELHTHGFVRRCFIPPAAIERLRTLSRHRHGLVEACAQQVCRMQKALEQMNLQLHKVLSDITGVTGMAILRAILAGERDPAELVKLRQERVKCSEKELADALTGHYSDEQLFVLKQRLDTYDFHHRQMRECDEQIQECLSQFPDHPRWLEAQARAQAEEPARRRGRRPGGRKRRKNEMHFDVEPELCRILGADLAQIPGLGWSTTYTLLSEVGFDLSMFATEKHFVSWLKLCSRNTKTGGRVKDTRTLRSTNRVASAFRIAAQSVARSDNALGAFYRRMRARLGAPQAVTATAHRIAVLVYRLLRYGQDYVDLGEARYVEQMRVQELQRLRHRAKALGMVLVEESTGAVQA